MKAQLLEWLAIASSTHHPTHKKALKLVRLAIARSRANENTAIGMKDRRFFPTWSKQQNSLETGAFGNTMVSGKWTHSSWNESRFFHTWSKPQNSFATHASFNGFLGLAHVGRGGFWHRKLCFHSFQTRWFQRLFWAWLMPWERWLPRELRFH